MHPHRSGETGKSMLGLADPAGKKIYAAFIETARIKGGGFVDYVGRRPGSDVNAPKLSYVSNFAPWGWVIGTGIYVDDIDEVFRQRLAAVGALVATIVLLVGGGTVMVSRGITRPLSGVVEALNRLAGGDATAPVKGQERKDEVGDVARSAEVLRSNEIRRRELEAAAGAERRAREERAAVITRLTAEFDDQVVAVIGAVASAAAQLESSAQGMSAVSDQTIRQATAVAAASEQAAANVQTVAAASEELDASSREIAAQVTRANEIARHAATQAVTTDELVRCAVWLMPRTRSARWSASSTTSPARPISWP